MDKHRRRKRVIVASDPQGRIVAAAYSLEEGEISSGLEALEDQTLHELDLPPELASLESPQAVLAALADARLTPGGALKLREMREEK